MCVSAASAFSASAVLVWCCPAALPAAFLPLARASHCPFCLFPTLATTFARNRGECQGTNEHIVGAEEFPKLAKHCHKNAGKGLRLAIQTVHPLTRMPLTYGFFNREWTRINANYRGFYPRPSVVSLLK
jgi:hypothetical protein